jgi:tRNA pseudouridine13 synthase
MPAEGGLPAAWRGIALDPPRALGDVPASGRLRTEPADFEVEERLGFEPDGGTAHRLVLVEKSGLNTLDVARALAAQAGRPPAEIGFAGLKDRKALVRQWFSVPASKDVDALAELAAPGLRVLSVHPHSRKLRRGALSGNAFRIRVRDLRGDGAAIGERVASIASTGVPGYFGEQRFGADGANLDRVHDWLVRGRLPRGREPRAFVLSAARSLLFNAVLGERVRTASWNRLLPGEVVNLAGSQSVFVADAPDATLERRCAEGDVFPTGPLPGAGGVAPVSDAGQVEARALAGLESLLERLAQVGLRAERRALVLRPGRLEHQIAGGALEIEFELRRGGFATSVLRELVRT